MENKSSQQQSPEEGEQPKPQSDAPVVPQPSDEAPKPVASLPPAQPSKQLPPCECPPPPNHQALGSTKMKKLIGILTVVCFILSLPLLAAGISSLYMRDYDCESHLHMQKMRITVGVAMILVFVISNLVIYYGSRCLMPGLLAATVPLMAMFILGLSFAGAFTVESRGVPNSPMWLKLRIGRHGYWTNIKTCLYRSEVCNDLGFRTTGLTFYQFSKTKLTMIEVTTS